MAMKEEHFVGIMGVPNATGCWQVAGLYNNGMLKISWVLAKRALLRKKQADKARVLEEGEERRASGASPS